MASVKYISFLGYNQSGYDEAVYPNPSNSSLQPVEPTSFVQEAFVQYAEQISGVKPKAILFLTTDARKNSFEGEGNLEQILAQRDVDVQSVDIPDGNTDDEFWEIFQKLRSVIEDGDELFLDVTHGFRVLPMVMLFAINYVRALKDIKIRGIWYGRLDRKTGQATTQDYATLIEVSDWASAARTLRKSGSFAEFTEVSRSAVQQQQTETKKQFNRRKAAQFQVQKSVSEILSLFETANARTLLENERWSELKSRFSELRESYGSIYKGAGKLVVELLEFAEEKLHDAYPAESRSKAIINWTAKHRMVQQGYTMLDELLTTYIIESLSENPTDKDIRVMISGYCKTPIPELKNRMYKHDQISLIQKLEGAQDLEKYRSLYSRITETRNALNHAGYDRTSPHPSYSSYVKNLEKLSSDFDKITN